MMIIPMVKMVVTVNDNNIDYAYNINININDIANNADDNDNDNNDIDIFNLVSIIHCHISVASVRLMPHRLYCVATMRTGLWK